MGIIIIVALLVIADVTTCLGLSRRLNEVVCFVFVQYTWKAADTIMTQHTLYLYCTCNTYTCTQVQETVVDAVA
jgi:hypothetical protein